MVDGSSKRIKLGPATEPMTVNSHRFAVRGPTKQQLVADLRSIAPGDMFKELAEPVGG